VGCMSVKLTVVGGSFGVDRREPIGQ